MWDLWEAADIITEKEFAAAVNSRSRLDIYEKMKSACVGIAGLGGLGSNIAVALARSGIGRLILADFDTVELSNINRQAYMLSHIGMKKTRALAEILREINPFCELVLHDIFVDEANCADIFADCPMICEAFDKAESKAMLVNALLSENKTAIIISGSGMAGFGRANDIATRRISGRFYLCGDGKTDISDGEGLSASRVMICAGHIASKACELILQEKGNQK